MTTVGSFILEHPYVKAIFSCKKTRPTVRVCDNVQDNVMRDKMIITGGRSSTSVNGDIAIQWEWSNFEHS